jgi:hypothetical protein
MMTAPLEHLGAARPFIDEEARWAAVLRRDAAADGSFYYSVRTTGVYCRPSCASRRARRENVAFHRTAADAAAAGFRPCKRCRPNAAASSNHPKLDPLDWRRIGADLDSFGCAVIKGLLAPKQCSALAKSYRDDGLFRSRVVMARHGFGKGEYKYFAYPLPNIVAALRSSLYPPIAEIANRWNGDMGIEVRYPAAHAQFLKRCHDAGQTKPTPLLLQYGEGDYNCLHQDLYGEQVFPLQVACLLSESGKDFTGGEFLLTEQRPRMQSRAEVVALDRGDGVIFPVHHRPVKGSRGFYRVKLRHGVSRLRSGQRHTLGIIFHDAR